MDSITIVGQEDTQLVKLLAKLGYQTHVQAEPSGLVEHIQNNHPDLVVINSCKNFDAQEFLRFIRDQENTRQVPIVYLAYDRADQLKVQQDRLERVEILTAPHRVGTIISKIATHVRLRKLNGADENNASIGEINARLRELNESFTKQLQEAQEIQMGLVPSKLPKDERFSIAVAYEPLEEVGGDWYYVQQEQDGSLRVHIADVTGHGLSAAFIGCMTKLAMHASGNAEPKEQLATMNRYMASCIPGGKFVTILSYLYDPATGVLKTVCAGHPPAMILQRASNSVIQVKSSGFAIGFFEEAEYEQVETILAPGDVALILTDALPEALNMSNQVYGYEHMEHLLLNSTTELNASKILQNVLEHFDNFRDGRILKDDVTVIVLKREK